MKQENRKEKRKTKNKRRKGVEAGEKEEVPCGLLFPPFFLFLAFLTECACCQQAVAPQRVGVNDRTSFAVFTERYV